MDAIANEATLLTAGHNALYGIIIKKQMRDIDICLYMRFGDYISHES